MTEWYYARNGQQSGPVGFEQLVELARSGGLDPAKDLVWNSSMKDWTPAGQVEGLFSAPSNAVITPATDPSNPYAAPQSAWEQPSSSPNSALKEIIPGSEPIDAMACVKRGFDLTKRQFGNILLVGVVYFAMVFGLSLVVGMIQGVLGVASSHGGEGLGQPGRGALVISALSQIVSQVFSMFIGLGLTRVALNFVSGKEVAVGQLFGEGHKLLRAIGASILFFLMVFIGLLLLVVPGIYLALRYGQYMVAIVDRDLGVMDSLSYSSSITTNNRMNLFVLGLLSILIVVAGMLACGVGMIFAGPVAWLSAIVAYRWMQYGHAAVLDQPGTTTPLLADR